jgi:hypothetical protein
LSEGCEDAPVSTRQRIVISLLLAAAVVGIVFAFQLAEEPEDAVIHRDSRVTNIFPGEDDTILRQDTISADVVFPYTGVLIIDGLEISEPQLKSVQVGSSTRLAYTPGADSITGFLRAGRHNAEVLFWKPDDGRDKASSFRWTFEVK